MSDPGRPESLAGMVRRQAADSGIDLRTALAELWEAVLAAEGIEPPPAVTESTTIIIRHTRWCPDAEAMPYRGRCERCGATVTASSATLSAMTRRSSSPTS